MAGSALQGLCPPPRPLPCVGFPTSVHFTVWDATGAECCSCEQWYKHSALTHITAPPPPQMTGSEAGRRTDMALDTGCKSTGIPPLCGPILRFFCPLGTRVVTLPPCMHNTKSLENGPLWDRKWVHSKSDTWFSNGDISIHNWIWGPSWWARCSHRLPARSAHCPCTPHGAHWTVF